MTLVSIHATSVIEDGAVLGEGTYVGPFCHVRGGARVGRDCVLGQGCYVAPGVVIGDRSRIQNGVSLYAGVLVGDEVFLGPHCVFTNVREPRAIVDRRDQLGSIRLGVGASVGANATIVAGVELFPHAFVAAGATVTRSVAAYAVVAGVPARAQGFRSRHGEALVFVDGRARCGLGGLSYALEGGAVRCLDFPDDAPWGSRVRIGAG